MSSSLGLCCSVVIRLGIMRLGRNVVGITLRSPCVLSGSTVLVPPSSPSLRSVVRFDHMIKVVSARLRRREGTRPPFVVSL